MGPRQRVGPSALRSGARPRRCKINTRQSSETSQICSIKGQEVDMKLTDISIMPQVQRSRRKAPPSCKKRVLTAGALLKSSPKQSVTPRTVILKVFLMISTLARLDRHIHPQAPVSSSLARVMPALAGKISGSQQAVAWNDEPGEGDENGSDGEPRSASQTALKLERLIEQILEAEGPSQRLDQQALMARPQHYGKSQTRASQQLRKLLARPRLILSSFVPQILSKQLVLRKPSHNYRRPSGGHRTNQLLAPSHFGRPFVAPAHRPNRTIVDSSSFWQTQMAPPPSDDTRSMRVPGFERNYKDHYHENRPPRIGPQFPAVWRPGLLLDQTLRPERESGANQNRMVIQISQDDQEAAQQNEDLQPATRRPPLQADEQRPVDMRRPPPDAENEAERGLNQIDHMIKKEFETQISLNELQPIKEPAASERGSNSSGGLMIATSFAQETEATTLLPGDDGRAGLDEAPGKRATRDTPLISGPIYIPWPPSRPGHNAEMGQQAVDSATAASLIPPLNDQWRQPGEFPTALEPDRGLLDAHTITSGAQIVAGQPVHGTQMSRPEQTADIVVGRDARTRPRAHEADSHIAQVVVSPPPTRPPIGSALTAFVPSPLETIAQLRLTNNNNAGDTNLPSVAHHQGRRAQTGGHKSWAADQAWTTHSGEHISLVNGRPRNQFSAPVGREQVARINADLQPAARNQQPRLGLDHYPGQASMMAAQIDGPPGDFRDTLRRLRETRERIRLLQAELNATQPNLLLAAAETNRSANQFVEQLSASQTSSEGVDQAQQPLALSSRQREQTRPWSTPISRTGASIFLPAQMVRAQQSMNMPLGLYHNGPLTTPARLVASALGRTMHKSLGASGVDAPTGLRANHRPSLDNAAAELAPSARPSSAPILLSSTISVAADVAGPTATSAPGSASSHALGGDAGHDENGRNKSATDGNKRRQATTSEGGAAAASDEPDEGDTDEEQGGSGASELDNGQAAAAAEGATGDQAGGVGAASLGDDSGDSTTTGRPAANTAAGDEQSKLPPAEQDRGDRRPAAFQRKQPTAVTKLHHTQQQSRLQAPTKDDKGVAKQAPLNQQAATESPIVIVEPTLSSSAASAVGRHHPPTVAANGRAPHPVLTTRKPIGVTRAPDSGRVAIISPTPASGESGATMRQLPARNTSQLLNHEADERRPAANSSEGFLSRLFNDLVEISKLASFRPAGDKSAPLAPKLATSSTAETNQTTSLASYANDDAHQHGRSLNLRGGVGPSSAASGSSGQSRLTTERVLHALVVVVSSLALIGLLVALTFARVQRACRSRERAFSTAAKAPIQRGPACSLHDNGRTSSEEASLSCGSHDENQFLAENQNRQRRYHQSNCSLLGDWRRFGPMNLLAQRQQQQANKLILDGTMRQVSLLMKHGHQRHGPPVDGRTKSRGRQHTPRPIVTRSCCHCAACNESRNQNQHHKQEHPAARGKLPFGAASSVSMIQRAARPSRSPQSQDKIENGAPQQANSEQDANLQHPTQSCQRIPIGGTRLRMMSAIDENACGGARQQDGGSDGNGDFDNGWRQSRAQLTMSGRTSGADLNGAGRRDEGSDCAHGIDSGCGGNGQHPCVECQAHDLDRCNQRQPVCCPSGCNHSAPSSDGPLRLVMRDGLSPTDGDERQPDAPDQSLHEGHDANSSFIVLDRHQHRFHHQRLAHQQADEAESAARETGGSRMARSGGNNANCAKSANSGHANIAAGNGSKLCACKEHKLADFSGEH